MGSSNNRQGGGEGQSLWSLQKEVGVREAGLGFADATLGPP